MAILLRHRCVRGARLGRCDSRQLRSTGFFGGLAIKDDKESRLDFEHCSPIERTPSSRCTVEIASAVQDDWSSRIEAVPSVVIKVMQHGFSPGPVLGGCKLKGCAIAVRAAVRRHAVHVT